jgi:RNA polymerase sigma-70 factor (ECF subfamily)
MTVIAANAATSSDVVEAFRRRDPAAVRAFYVEYRPLVYAVAHRVLGRHDLAEDAVQQTFIRAWRAGDRIDVGRNPAPWLGTIAKRVAIDIYRYETKRATRTDAARDLGRNMVDAGPDPAALDVVVRVRRAIAALPTKLAEVVRLQHLDGLSQAEISEQLGIPVGTVKSRSHHAYRLLMTRLATFDRSRAHEQP